MKDERDSKVVPFPVRLLTGALVLTGVALLAMAWSGVNSYRNIVTVQVRDLHIAELRGAIVHLDEVLTMSARMAAATGGSDWERRYRQFEPQLDSAIREAVLLTARSDRAAATAQTDAANLKLVEMENRSFALVRAGKAGEARVILFADAYAAQKKIYAGGMATLIQHLNEQLAANHRQQQHEAIFSIVATALCLVLLFFTWLSILAKLKRVHKELFKVNRALQTEVGEHTRAEGELQWKTAFLEAQVNSAIDGILVVDQEGKKLLQNQRFVDLLNIPEHIADENADEYRIRWFMDKTKNPEQFVQKVLYLYAHPDEISRDEIELKDGTVLDRYSSPVVGKDGKYYGRIWAFRDITERKAVEESLRDSEEKFRQLADNIGDVFWMTSPDLQQMHFVSAAYEHIWGRSTESLYAHPHQWVEAILPEERERVFAAFGPLMGSEPRLSIEYRIARPDGTIRWIHDRGFQVRDAAGQLIRLTGIASDITERKRIEEAIQRQQTELRVLFDLMPAMILFKDTENGILRVNKRVAENAGKSVEEIEGKPALEIFPQDAARFYADDLEVIRSGAPKLGIVDTVRGREGKEHWIQTDKVPVCDKDGKVVGIVVMAQDITERKLAEKELRQRVKLQDQLVNTAATVPGMIYSFQLRPDGSSRMPYASSAFENIFGLQPRDVMEDATPVFSLIHPDDIGHVKEGIAESARTLNPWRDDFRVCQSRRGEIWVEGHSVPHREPDGSILWHGFIQDITARKQSEERLRESQRFLQSTLDALSAHIAILDVTGVIIAVNAAWKSFAATNNFMGRLFGVGSNYLDVCESATGDCAEEAGTVVTGIRAVMANQQGEFHLEYPCHSPGEQRWFMVRVTRFVGDGPVRIVVAHENITQRRQADEKLEKAHRQLLETSRQAGMAEVATSVLHNVGNVLNSVNVSATLVADNTKKSKAPYLHKVVALLNEHAADLGAFMVNDPKGRQLPGYLSQLAGQLATEQQNAIAELAGLQKNIEHIKDIVAMQQSYAKVSGVTETLQISDLVEDALHMNASALTRHEVQVVREYAEVPPVTIEKYKVLQILVNLIRNAKYACDESGRSDKRMTMRVTNGGNRVRISISDNGVGIPAENLIRIFNYGFTTRKEGHGFGLHSGALAARELGGSLNVHSEGPGQGAVFTLELPIKQESSTKWNAA